MRTLKLLSTDEVLSRTGLARSTFWAKRKAGQFPAPVRLGARSVMYRPADVRAWMKSAQVFAS